MRRGDLERFVGPLARRVAMTVARGIVRLADDAPAVQTLQIGLLADETHDGVERFQEYGFTSVPLAGAEAVVVHVGGTRSHGIAIAVEDRRFRPTGLQPGDVAVYDRRGQSVRLTADGIVVTSAVKVTVDAPAIALGAGGQPVARVGDAVAGGKIVAGSGVVTAG